VLVPVDDVSNIVQVAGNRCQLDLALRVTQHVQNVVTQARHVPGVFLIVRNRSHRAQVLVDLFH